MGCGNNKVSRDYLTSQPVSTPSPRAAKASAANLGNQVLRVISQMSRQSADRAAQARADAVSATKAAETKREAERQTAAKKAEAKQKNEAREQREHERLRDDLAYQAAAFAANQPTTYTGQDGREREAWERGVTTHSGGFQYMTRADGMTTTESVHVSTIAKKNGDFDVHLSDGNGRVATFDLTGADAADDLVIAACQEYLYDIMRDRERES